MLKLFILIFLILFGEVTFAEDYNRGKHFGNGWIDADHDGQNTREEVLEEESLVKVEKDKNGKIIWGIWFCRYTGKFFDNPKDLDIDHVVPLKECWISGGDLWSEEKRIRYANYLGKSYHLIAVDKGSNREKGAKDVKSWLPDIRVKEYIVSWVLIKEKWDLCYDFEEAEELSEYGFFLDNICEEK